MKLPVLYGQNWKGPFFQPIISCIALAQRYKHESSLAQLQQKIVGDVGGSGGNNNFIERSKLGQTFITIAINQFSGL